MIRSQRESYPRIVVKTSGYLLGRRLVVIRDVSGDPASVQALDCHRDSTLGPAAGAASLWVRIEGGVSVQPGSMMCGGR